MISFSIMNPYTQTSIQNYRFETFQQYFHW